MGINKSALRLLLLAKKEKVDLSNMLTLGRLRYYGDKDLRPFQQYLTNPSSNYSDEYSESFYSSLGVKNVDTLDYSDYEGAKIIHDLNVPFDDSMSNKYTVLLDSGTLEHVFKYPTAIESCMKSIRVGGSFIGISPCNNMMGHGFYQFGPELYYRIFSEANGFRVKHMFLVSEDTSEKENMIWYGVPDPKEVKSRIMLCNSIPMYMMVIAEKISDKEVFKSTPQQSDYQTTWDVHQSIVKNERDDSTSILKHWYRKYTPAKAKQSLRKIYAATNDSNTFVKELGEVNTNHFIPFDIEKYLHE